MLLAVCGHVHRSVSFTRRREYDVANQPLHSQKLAVIKISNVGALELYNHSILDLPAVSLHRTYASAPRSKILFWENLERVRRLPADDLTHALNYLQPFRYGTVSPASTASGTSQPHLAVHCTRAWRCARQVSETIQTQLLDSAIDHSRFQASPPGDTSHVLCLQLFPRQRRSH